MSNATLPFQRELVLAEAALAVAGAHETARAISPKDEANAILARSPESGVTVADLVVEIDARVRRRGTP